MNIFDLTVGGHVIDTCDDRETAYENAGAYADAHGQPVTIVNRTPGEPRYLLDTIEPAYADA